MVDAVLAELPPLISESDMHVSQMALSFLSTLAHTHPSALGQLSGGAILSQLIVLVRSPLLQGGALAAMLDFYKVCPSVCLPLDGFVCIIVCIIVCLSVSLCLYSVCPSVCVSVCLSACLSLSLSVFSLSV